MKDSIRHILYNHNSTRGWLISGSPAPENASKDSVTPEEALEEEMRKAAKDPVAAEEESADPTDTAETEQQSTNGSGDSPKCIILKYFGCNIIFYYLYSRSL